MEIYTILRLISYIVDALTLIIIIQSVLSWFVSPINPLYFYLSKVTEPIIGPIRRKMPYMGGLDVSPLIALLLLKVIEYALTNIIYYIFISF